jgi:hypothetical protein
MRRFLTGVLIGAVVAAVVAGSVYSATSLLYISGTLTSGHTLVVTSDGFGVVDAGLPPFKIYDLTWGPGQNLSTAPLPMGVVGPGAPAALVMSASCAIGATLGGAGTIDICYATSGTSLTGCANKITSVASCQAGGAANSIQTGLSGTPTIPANSYFGVVATGAGWPGTGSGVIQLTLQQ